MDFGDPTAEEDGKGGMEAVLHLFTVDAVNVVDLQSSKFSFHSWALSSNFITMDTKLL